MTLGHPQCESRPAFTVVSYIFLVRTFHLRGCRTSAITNSVVSDPPQASAICDVVAQLIYWPNSRSIYVLTKGQSVLLDTKTCDRHQKGKNNSIMQHQHATTPVAAHLHFPIVIYVHIVQRIPATATDWGLVKLFSTCA